MSYISKFIQDSYVSKAWSILKKRQEIKERKQNKVVKKLSISDFKFGIELESNIRTYKLRESTKFENGWRAHGEHCGSEIVSPILQGYKGLMSVRRQLRNIWKFRNKIKFEDSGLHVHVDIQHFNLGQAKNLILIASRFDQTIYCLMSGARWYNQYARRCSYVEKSIIKAKGLAALQSLQSDRERYSGINLHAFSKHGTVEFRYAAGSANWQKIYSLISMYLRMVAAAEAELEIPEPAIVTKFNVNTSRKVCIQTAKKYLPKLVANRDMFFDFLQIRGDTRECLIEIFNANVFDIRANQQEETREKIKFSLKRD